MEKLVFDGKLVEVELECGRSISPDYYGNSNTYCSDYDDSTSNQTSATCCY